MEVITLSPLTAGYAEGRTFSTHIFRSTSGVEVRATRLNDSPPRYVRARWKTVNAAERATLDNLLAIGRRTAIGMPLWHSKGELTANTNGTVNVYLDTTEAEWAGPSVDWVLLYRPSTGAYALAELDKVNATYIELIGTVPLNAFQVGDWAIPVIVAMVAERAGLTAPEDLRRGEVEARLEEV
jgi:hypothetical protein